MATDIKSASTVATGMERLRFMQGDWDVEAHVMTESGEWMSIPEPYETTIVAMNGGACHREIMPIMLGGERTRLLFSWSYDKFRQRYRMLSCADTDGVMGILEGGFMAGTDMVVISDLKTGTAFPGSTEENAYFRQLASTKTSEDCFVDVVSESYDQGVTWEPVFRAKHTRKSGPNLVTEQA